ncbi:MAG TPA: hypothetical protein VKY57_10900 [Chitinispirillaceae bacterium]|nr:hypothetical protein [Chitinispirillaceae bacterium]
MSTKTVGDELFSPRKELDLPGIITGLNVKDTIPGAENKNFSRYDLHSHKDQSCAKCRSRKFKVNSSIILDLHSLAYIVHHRFIN